jgi:hypothetical protein
MKRGCSSEPPGGLPRASGGFVLAEVFIAVGLSGLVSAGLIGVYLMSLRTWREGSAQVALQRKLTAAMQRMVQGERGMGESRQHGLREAKDITVVNPRTIEFVSGVDMSKRRFYLSGNEVIYAAETSGNEETIYDPSRSEPSSETSNYRTDVQFSQLADGTVEVRLVGEERMGDRWVNAALATRIAPRNQQLRLDDN